MRSESFQQYAIVAADSALDLTERLNKKLYELREKNPTVTFEGMIARIQYTEKRVAPESLADEYREKGVQLTCQDCPYFEPITKSDGSVDRRIRWGLCGMKESGRTSRDVPACDILFRQINNGFVKLTLDD